MADIGIIKFELAHMNFCMHADCILEIVRYGGARTIPCPLPYVVGILELRRHIVAVVDLHKRVGLPSLPLTKDTVMIVTTLSSGTFGILVDNIYDFRRVPEERILPPISIAGFPENLLRGVLTDADDILPIPNFDKIFSSFIAIHLVPINLSEKIAFHYRFTPGSLTQTLEKNLLTRQSLDYDMVKKLPRSLYMPSTNVHRMTTYYADFLPRHQSEEEQPVRFVSVSRAGDEHYTSLSQQLKAQQRHTGEKQQQTGNLHTAAQVMGLADVDASTSPSVALEQMLHQGLSSQPEATFRPYYEFPEYSRLRASVGRPLAQKFRITPVRMTGYLSYYHAEEHDEAPISKAAPLSERSADTVLPYLQRPESGESLVHALLKTLHLLHHSHCTLTRTMVAELCTEYQVSPLKLARILSFFPEYTVPVMLDTAPDSEHSKMEIQETPQTVMPSTTACKPVLHIDTTAACVTDNLWQLADQHALFDRQALRDVASRRGLPTCRISKLQRYYWCAHE